MFSYLFSSMINIGVMYEEVTWEIKRELEAWWDPLKHRPLQEIVPAHGFNYDWRDLQLQQLISLHGLIKYYWI